MKKLSIVAALLMAALVFTGCPNPNNADSGTGNTGSGDAGSGDSNTTTVTFDDCTTSITRDQIVLSDGQWAIKREDEGPTSLETYSYEANSSSNKLTFTSGTYTMVQDFAAKWTDFYSDGSINLSTYTEEQQLEFFNQLFNLCTNTISGTVVTSTRNYTADELESYSKSFTFNSIQEDADIKINSAATKCKIVWTIPDINFTIRIFAHKL